MSHKKSSLNERAEYTDRESERDTEKGRKRYREAGRDTEKEREIKSGGSLPFERGGQKAEQRILGKQS